MVFGHFFPEITQNCISHLVTNIAIINLGIGCVTYSLWENDHSFYVSLYSLPLCDASVALYVLFGETYSFW